MQKEFNVEQEEANFILSSQEELLNFFNDTTFKVEIKENKAYITNKYQTKKILIEADNIKDEFNASRVSKLQEGLYLLEFDTQKRTKAAYEFFQTVDWIKNVECDEVLYVNSINDESQTMYGDEEKENETKYKTYGIEAMGLSNYQNIIRENGNPSEVTVATIGYGARIEDEYFRGRISENYYNFLEDSKNTSETIPQGSRILEVIKDATTENIKIMPLVVVNAEGYTTVSSIVKAIEFATQNSDVICYELVNKNNYMINLSLQNAFKENVPVSCVTTQGTEKEEIYPANNATTIAISSIDKKSKITSFSGKGDYIDFAAHSTDVEEIFNTNIGVSKWSGSQYSNAHIVAIIALIKSYNKESTILEIYNILRNYSKDLGDKGKDLDYGYGCPNFSEITIKDIDKKGPEIKEIKYDNEKWEKSKQIQIIASDNIRIYSWGITTKQKPPTKWNKQEEIKPMLDTTQEIKENNKYYIWVEDSAENISYMPIEINKIDNDGPIITNEINTDTLEEYGYVTISVKAEDDKSGLHEFPYSWDGQNWGKDSNILKVTENGRYKVYVRDALENISEKEIIVDVFPRKGEAKINRGKIIKSINISKDWNGDTNNSVRITFNENLNMIGWRITTSSETPRYFEEINNYETEDLEITENDFEEENMLQENQTNIEPIEQIQGYNYSLTITRKLKTNITYYVWIKDANGNIISQTFSIRKEKI